MATEHGERRTYVLGCRCAACTVANREYQRQYMRGYRTFRDPETGKRILVRRRGREATIPKEGEVSASDLARHAGAILNAVGGGSTVHILRHGKHIATVIPAEDPAGTRDGDESANEPPGAENYRADGAVHRLAQHAPGIRRDR